MPEYLSPGVYVEETDTRPKALALVDRAGSEVGEVRVQGAERTRREVALNAAADVSAKRHDLAVITAVNNALAVLTATASSEGGWRDDLSVQILPMVGARRTL